MGFDLRQLNPLDYFREFSLFPRAVFFVGLIVLIFGLAEQVSFRNPTILAGATLILFALTCYYWSHPTWSEPNPPYKNHLSLTNLISGLFCLGFTLLSLLWMVRASLGEATPHWVKGFWQKVAALVWSF